MMRLLRIAGREYVAYVKTVGFWLSMLMMPVVGGLAFLAPALLEKNAPPPAIAIFDLTGEGYRAPIGASLTGKRDGRPRAVVVDIEDLPTPGPEQLKALLAEKTGSRGLSAAVMIRGAGEAITIDYWSRNLTDRTLERQVTSAVAAEMRARKLVASGIDVAALKAADALEPKVASFSPRAGAGGKVAFRDRLPGIVGFGTAMLLWMMILTGAGILLNSVIEEKSNRVLEVLLASASVPEIMFGKILGVAGVTLTVLAVWTSVGATGLIAARPDVAADIGAVLLGFGIGIEILQGLPIVGRDADVFDIVADTLGIGFFFGPIIATQWLGKDQ